MTLNKDALVHIGEQALHAAGAFQQEAPADTLVLPENHRLHDLRSFQPTKRRFTGKLRTSDLNDFIGYTKAHANQGAEGFIDAENLSCTMFYNLGDEATPGHADWRAELTLKGTAPYNALLEANGSRLDQAYLATWLEDWADFLTPFGQDEGVVYGNVGKAVAAVRKITIKASSESESTVGDFAATRTSMEEVEARSKLELPAGFIFRCCPYLGLTDRSFRLRLQVLTGHKEPLLVLRIVQLEAKQEAIAQEFKEVLLSDLADAATLTIGTFSV